MARTLIAAALALLLAVPPGASTANSTADEPLREVIDALETPAAPGARTANALRALAEGQGRDVAPYASCPSLAEGLARHAQRMGVAVPPLPPVSADVDQALGCLLGALDEANRAHDEVFAGLDAETRFRLYQSEDEPAPELLQALEGRDGRPILRSAVHVAEAVDLAIELLRRLDHPAALTGINVEPILRFEPAGAQTYTDNYALIVDLEGDDTYDNHAGGIIATVGNAFFEVEPGSEWLHVGPVAGWQAGVGGGTQDGDFVLSAGLVLDVAGNDVYGVKHPPILTDVDGACGTDPRVPYVGTIGAGIMGVGMLFDLAGDNTYTGRTQTQGAGHVFGVGALYAGPGRDVFEGIRGAQGSGLLGGSGLLINEGGDDEYRLDFPAGGVFNGDRRVCDADARYGQGGNFDRKDGPFTPQIGILAELGGNDLYVSPHQSQGFSQGSGFGLLLEVSGHDRYESGERAQGVGHGRAVDFDPQAIPSGGLGVVLDREGNDVYVVGANGQGWALGDLLVEPLPPNPNDTNELLLWAVRRDEAVGLLLDVDGVDSYTMPGRADGASGFDGSIGLYVDLA
jgi:hypothetical protein